MSVVLIPFGRRAYGRVHSHGGEYAVTQFAHVFFVPLIPLASFWVTNEPGAGKHAGFPIKLHGPSVRAAYARVWLPILGGCMLIVPSLIATAIGVALIALAGWSWRGRSRRGARALQRSDFDRVALGHRCDPAWMTNDMRDHMSRRFAAELAQREDPRPPDDVARFGARSVDEAVLAYGILRLTSTRGHHTTTAATDRLLSSVFDHAAGHGEPYREGPSPAVPGFGAAIAATAQAAAARSEAHQRATAASRWFHDIWAQAMIVVATTCAALALLYGRAPALEVDDAALAARPPIDHRASVRCDRVADLGWKMSGDGHATQRIVFCLLGTHVLPVVHDEGDDPIDHGAILGTLHHLPSTATGPWVREIQGNADLDARCYHDLYLEHESETNRHVAWVAAIACGLGAIVGWGLWIPAFRRRRQAAA